MSGFEVHRHQKSIKDAVRRVGEDKGVCERNKALIISFSKTRLAKGIGRLRVCKCIYCLRYLAKWLRKPFDKASKNDLIRLVGKIENKDYSENSKYDFKVVLKILYKWLRGDDEAFPQEVSWLKPKVRNNGHKLPEELLTDEEVFRLAKATDNPRDRAFVLVLYESGCRIGEIISLKMKNVVFDQYGVVLRVTGKTGDRRVRIISSAPALASWVQIHAKADDPEAPLWPPLATSHRYQDHPIEYRSVYVLLLKLAERAGIKKRIYPHLFRHSRATSLAGKLTEAQMKEHFGWAQSSDMAAVYVHLSGRDVDNALLALQGMAKPDEKKEEKLKLRFCPRCQEKNAPIAKFCIRCGTPLEESVMARMEDERKNADGLMNELMKNSEFKEFIIKKISELGLKVA